MNKFALSGVGIAVSATEDSGATSGPSTKEVLSLILGKSFYEKANSTFLPGRSIQGAVILTDRLPSDHQHADFNLTVQKIAARVVNYQQIQKEVPFGITRWGGVYSGPCPTMPRAHYAERGLTWAHYRIWRDFAYFDPIVETKYEKLRQANTTQSMDSTKSKDSPNGRKDSTMSSKDASQHKPSHGLYTIQRDAIVSHDHLYRITFGDGKRYKGGELMQNDDILIILEDDAVSTVKDLAGTLQDELKDLHSGLHASKPYSYMGFDGNLPSSSYFNPKAKDGDIFGGSNPHDDTGKAPLDIVYLGWCEGRLTKPAPICSHAYAITRFTARKLIHYIEPCGEALDLQLATIIKNGWMRFRRANSYSYSADKIRPDYSEAGSGNFKDFGIFRQCKSHCGSFMTHRH